eukprot:759460-Hanusia_phi.AAC.1
MEDLERPCVISSSEPLSSARASYCRVSYCRASYCRASYCRVCALLLSVSVSKSPFAATIANLTRSVRLGGFDGAFALRSD